MCERERDGANDLKRRNRRCGNHGPRRTYVTIEFSKLIPPVITSSSPLDPNPYNFTPVVLPMQSQPTSPLTSQRAPSRRRLGVTVIPKAIPPPPSNAPKLPSTLPLPPKHPRLPPPPLLLSSNQSV